MRIAFYTLGCKVNQYETQALEQLVTQRGHTLVPFDGEADAYVINTCSVTAVSDKKSRQVIRRARKTAPDAILAVCGCYSQTHPDDMDKLEVDLVAGTGDRTGFVDLLEQTWQKHQSITVLDDPFQRRTFENLPAGGLEGRTRAMLKIEDGCVNFCSYCIIPYARGRVRSKSMEDLQAELQQIGENGYREVVLTGINLSAYGQELGLTLCDAVEAACRVPGICRVRLGSLEPEQLSPAVIARLAQQEKLCPQFHLSLQSGCDETLRRMNRHYDTAEYRRIVEDLRRAFPNCAITTDIMVGFAGETGEEFEKSLRFAEETAFAKVHVFMYSRRRGTRADTFPDQVKNADKEARSRRMIAVTRETQRAFLESQVGLVQPVLFEQTTRDGRWEGYTPNYTPVRVESSDSLAGQIRPVRLSAREEEWCVGTLV